MRVYNLLLSSQKKSIGDINIMLVRRHGQGFSFSRGNIFIQMVLNFYVSFLITFIPRQQRKRSFVFSLHKKPKGLVILD